MPGISGVAEAQDLVPPSGIVDVGDHGVAVRGLGLTLRDWTNLPDWTEKEPGSVFRWGDAELPAHFLSHRGARLDTRAGEPLRLRARAEFDLRHWSVAEGLPHDKIRCLKVARDGTLWLGTVGGLAVWDPATERVVAKHLDRMSIDDDLRTNLVVRDLQLGRDGLMWMGSSAGTWRVVEGGSVPRSFL